MMDRWLQIWLEVVGGIIASAFAICVISLAALAVSTAWFEWFGTEETK